MIATTQPHFKDGHFSQPIIFYHRIAANTGFTLYLGKNGRIQVRKQADNLFGSSPLIFTRLETY